MCDLVSNPQIASYFNLVTCNISRFGIPLIFALALAAFIWGVVQFFIIGADEEAKREQGKQFILWGIVALTVMLSVWGLVRILGTTFGVRTNVIPHTSTTGGDTGTGTIGGEGMDDGSGGGGGGVDMCGEVPCGEPPSGEGSGDGGSFGYPI